MQISLGETKLNRIAIALTACTLALTGCEEGAGGGFFDNLKSQRPAGSASEGGASAPNETSTKLVERDVEAPEAFQVTDSGLWDGRPSLGGVWVAHVDVTDPERVIIRNTENGKFVIGALFRREVTSPGPGLQVSSDAAEALGMLAGAPAQLNVTALRREEVKAAPVAPQTGEEIDAIATPEEVTATTLDDPIADAAKALDELEKTSPPAMAAPAATATTAATKPEAKPSKLDKPYIQIGIFSVQSNANRTTEMLASQGLSASIKPGNSAGKKFWRVVVGPAATATERKNLLAKVKKAGFTDAYAVTH